MSVGKGVLCDLLRVRTWGSPTPHIPSSICSSTGHTSPPSPKITDSGLSQDGKGLGTPVQSLP